MRPPLLLALAIGFCITTVYAQQNTFRISYNFSAIDIPGAVIQNPAGNYVMAGTAASFIPIRGNVTELDVNGNIVWTKGYLASIATEISDIKNVSGGGYVVTGSTNSGCLLARLDNTGAVVWANRYRVGSSTREYGSKVIQASDGGFVVAGYVHQADPDGGGPLARQDSANLFCMKVNSAGTLLWAKVFFVTTAYIDDHYLRDVAEVSDGYIFVGNMTTSAGDGPKDAILLKTDLNNGTLQWIKRFAGGSNSQSANTVTRLSGTQVLVSGYENSRMYYLRLNSDGTTPSPAGRTFTFPGLLAVAEGYSAVVTHDGHYAFMGNYIVPFSFSFTAFLMKVNSGTGNAIFTRSYNAGLSSILPIGTQVADSGYILNMTAQQIPSFNYHVIKTDVNGLLNNSNCPQSNVSPSASNYTPTLNNVSPLEISGASTNSVSFTVSNLNPIIVIDCSTPACTPPATPTAVASASPICSGTATTISGSGSGSGVTYKVYTAATGGTFLGNAPLSVSPSATTTYYVEAELDATPGCVSSSRGSVTVTVHTPPTAPTGITGTTSICNGSSTTLTVSGGSNGSGATVQWFTGSCGGTSVGTGNSITVSPTSNTTYYVRRVGNTTCTNTTTCASVTVTVQTPPTAPTGITGITTICNGTSTTLTVSGGSNGSGANVEWFTGSCGGTFIGTGNSITVSPGTNTTYYVRRTGNTACTTSTACASVTVTVQTPPTAPTSITGTTTICNGTSTTLTVSGGSNGSGATVEWFTGSCGGTPAGTGNSITVSPSTTTTYYVRRTGNTSCTASTTCASVTVTVETPPTAPTGITGTTTICNGTSTTLTVSGGSNGSGATVEWFTGSCGGTAAGTGNSITVSPSTTTTYYVRRTGTTSCTNSTTCASVTVTVQTPPTAPTGITGTTTICNGDATTLTVSGGSNGSGATVEWFTGSCGGTPAGTGNSITVSPSTTTTYYVRRTGNTACTNSTACVNTTVTVVNPPTVISAVSGAVNPCPGSQAYSISAVTNATNYTWSVSGGGTITGGQGTTGITVNWTTAGGPYTVSVVASNSCGSVSNTTSVTVQNAAPSSISSITGSSNPCPGSQAYSISAVTNATSYVWSVSAGGTITSGQGTTGITVNWTTAGGPYTISVVASNSCGSVSNSASVTVQNAAPASVSSVSGNTSPCPGNQNYNISAVPNATSYTWSVSAGGTITSGQGTTGITVNWTTAGGPYTVSVVASNSCGSASNSTTVNVQPLPGTIGAISGNNNPCPGAQTYSIASVANASTYTWSVGSGGTITGGQGTTSITINWTTSGGPYTVSVTAGNTCGTVGTSLNVNVQNPTPGAVGAIAGNTNPCPGSQAYSISAVTNATNYTWSVSGGGTITGGQGTTGITVNWTTAGGPYTVSVVASNACGSTSNSVNVNVQNAAPTVVGAISGDINPCPVSENYSIAAVTNATNYTWSVSGGGTITSGQGTTGITVNWTSAGGPYTVSVVASNSCGSASNSVAVNVRDAAPTVVGAISGDVNPCPVPENYSIAAVTNATNYTWSVSGGGTITSGQGTTSITVDWTTAGGPYTVSVVASNSCGSASNSVAVNVRDAAPTVVGAISGDVNPCPVSENYSIAAVTNATNYTWSVSGGGTITSGQGTTSITVDWTTAGGPYTVSVIASNSCGSASNSVAVNVRNAAPTVVGAISGDVNPCPVSENYSIAAVTNATNYTWSVSGGGTITSGQGTTGITVNWTTAGGPYTVSVIASNSCGSASNSVAVDVRDAAPTTVSAISGNMNPCPVSENYSIAAVTNATNYTWSVSGGGTITSGQGTTAITVNWTSDGGPYTISVIASNSCGNASNTAQVIVEPNVTGVSATLSPNPACAGNTVNFTGSGNGVTNWNWTGPNGFNSTLQNPSIAVIQTNAAGIYTLTAGSVCGTVIVHDTLTVNDVPQNVSATVSPNPACVGNTIQFTGSGQNVDSWAWSGPDNFSSAQQNPSIASATLNANGNYTLAATNTCGTTNAVTSLLVHEPPVNVQASANPNPVCDGAALTLSGSAGGATSYTWSGPNNFSSNSVNAAVTNFSSADSGDYVFTATNFCGSTQSSVYVNWEMVPTVVAAGANATNLCSGSSLQLMGSSAGATSFSWSGPNGFSSTQQNPTIVNLTLADSGLYVFTAINVCGTTSASVNVDADTLIENVSITSSPNDTLCAGNAIQLTGGGDNINNWNWTGPNGFVSAQQNSAIANAGTVNSGTYFLTAINACGSITDSLFVLVDSIPVSPASINGLLTVCGWQTASYTASNISNAEFYTWTLSSGGTIIAGQGTATIDVAWGGVNGTYDLSVTAGNHCGNSTTASVPVEVLHPAPVFASGIIGDTLGCYGAESYSVVPVAGASNYAWAVNTGGTITAGQGTESIDVAWTMPGGPFNVNVTVSNSCGSADTSLLLTINLPPNHVAADASPNPVCEGGTLALIGNHSEGTSFYWHGPAGFTSILEDDTIYNFQNSNVGTYTFIATNYCGSDSASVNVSILVPPSNATAISNITGTGICTSSILNLSGSATGASSYIWHGPDSYASTQQNPVLNPVTLADSGQFVMIALNACGSDTAYVAVDVDSIISNMSITASPTDTVCVGDNLQLFADGMQVNTWSWTGPNGFVSTEQNPLLTSLTTSGTGNYIVTGTNACGDMVEAIYIVVNTIPVSPGTVNGLLTVCGLDTAAYTAATVSNADSYTWTLSGGGSIIAGQGTNTIHIAWGATAGNYSISVITTNKCGSSAATTIGVDVLPPAPVMNTFITGDTSVCPSLETYSISQIPNATSYTWTVSSGGSVVSGQNTSSINVNWTTAGAHTITVTASNTCGVTSPAAIDVTVHPAPTPATVTLTDDTICEGNNTTITATNSTGGTVSYNFYDAATGGNLLGVSPLTVSPALTTTYYLELENQFGCKNSGGRTPVTVYVLPAPAILSITPDNSSICYNTSTTITAVTTAGATITWWDSPAGGNLLETGNTFQTPDLTADVTYYVLATSSGGCDNLQGMVPVSVSVIPLPEVTITSDKDNHTVFPGEAITFTALPAGYANYEFFVNRVSVQSGSLNTWTTESLNDKDTVSVIATDNGCNSVADEVVVTVVDFPNAFTPNNDGVNDIFLKGYDLIILNRWGQELYRGLDGWDGMYNGTKVAAGTYYYLVTIESMTDRKNVIKGTVLLIGE